MGTHLDLGSNDISNIGINAISSSLQINSTLVELNLFGNNDIDDACLENLAKILKKNNVLRKITITGEIPLDQLRGADTKRLNLSLKGYNDNDAIIIAAFLEI